MCFGMVETGKCCGFRTGLRDRTVTLGMPHYDSVHLQAYLNGLVILFIVDILGTAVSSVRSNDGYFWQNRHNRD